jgi:hypothetical protein
MPCLLKETFNKGSKGGTKEHSTPVRLRDCSGSALNVTYQSVAKNANPANRSPKLLELVSRRLRAQHNALRTEEAYVHWIRRFILFHGERHPRF